jgi:hypothetical protein
MTKRLAILMKIGTVIYVAVFHPNNALNSNRLAQLPVSTVKPANAGHNAISHSSATQLSSTSIYALAHVNATKLKLVESSTIEIQKLASAYLQQNVFRKSQDVQLTTGMNNYANAVLMLDSATQGRTT